MTQKTFLEIRCKCAKCGNQLVQKSSGFGLIHETNKPRQDFFGVVLEPCKICAQKARLKMKKVRERFHRRHSKPFKIEAQPQPQDQEAIMAKHAASGFVCNIEYTRTN